MIIKKIENCNHSLLIIAVYCLSHIWIILNNGIFWDDWTWYQNHHGLAVGLEQLGFGPVVNVFMEVIYENSIGILFSKFIIFILYLFIGLIFRKILDSFSTLSKNDKLLISLFFILAPVNFARNYLCTANNALNVLFFMIASWIIIGNSKEKFKVKNLLSYIFFFFSYFTNSLLPFTAVIYLLIFFKIREEKAFQESIYFFIKNHVLLLVLPILFWIIKLTYFKPFGNYNNYNEISIFPIAHFLKSIIVAIKTSLFQPILYSIPFLRFSTNTLMTIYLIILILIIIYRRKTLLSEDKHSLKLIGFGFFTFIIGVFPYIAVGKIPLSNSIESRHQLLVPFGFSIIVFFSIQFFLKNTSEKFKNITKQIFVVFLIIANFKSNMEFQKMHHRQMAIMHEFKTNPIFQYNYIYLIDDKATSLGAFGVNNASPEYSGMLYEVFKNQKRIAVNKIEETAGLSALSKEELSQLKLSQLIVGKPTIKVTMLSNYPSDSLHTLLYLFSPKQHELMTFQYESI